MQKDNNSSIGDIDDEFELAKNQELTEMSIHESKRLQRRNNDNTLFPSFSNNELNTKSASILPKDDEELSN